MNGRRSPCWAARPRVASRRCRDRKAAPSGRLASCSVANGIPPLSRQYVSVWYSVYLVLRLGNRVRLARVGTGYGSPGSGTGYGSPGSGGCGSSGGTGSSIAMPPVLPGGGPAESGSRVFRGLDDLQLILEPRDREDSPHGMVGGHDDAERDPARGEPALALDQGVQPGGVEEADLRQIDDDQRRGVRDGVEDLEQPRRRGHVDLSRR